MDFVLLRFEFERTIEGQGSTRKQSMLELETLCDCYYNITETEVFKLHTSHDILSGQLIPTFV